MRPTRRRLARVALPLLLELRFKNPCCRLRRIFEGWYWRFINPLRLQIRPALIRSRWKTPFVGAPENISERFGVKRGTRVICALADSLLLLIFFRSLSSDFCTLHTSERSNYLPESPSLPLFRLALHRVRRRL